MSASMNDQDDDITGINVTPLVDVMLVLLIIFMVTANYIVSQSINVSLPKSQTSDQTKATDLAIVLDKGSNIFINGKPTTFEKLESEIQLLQSKESLIQARIAADKETPHGSVIRIIGLVRRLGITDFAINVELEPTAQK